MNPLTIPQVPEGTPKEALAHIDVEKLSGDEVKQYAGYFNALANTAMAAASYFMAEIKDNGLWKDSPYRSWPQFYRGEWGREKETMTKLLTCGHWIKEKGVIKDILKAGRDLKYTRLYNAILRLPDAAPEEVLSEAMVNSEEETADNARDKKLGPQHEHTLGKDLWTHCTDPDCNKLIPLPNAE